MDRDRSPFDLLIHILEDDLERAYVIVETGTLRVDNMDYRRGDGHSARKFAQFLREQGMGSLFSVDIDPEAVKVCQGVMDREFPDVHTEVIHSDSVAYLESFEGTIDVLYLDSANDADLILNEAIAGLPKLRERGWVLIDDATEKKGEKVVPWLKNQGFTVLAEGYQVLFQSPSSFFLS